MNLEYIQTQFIDGRPSSGSSGLRVAVESPATESPFALADDTQPADIDLAVAAARRAFESGEWAATTQGDRGRVILAACDQVEKQADEIAELQAREMGAAKSYLRFAALNCINVVRRQVDLAASAVTEEHREGMWRSVVRHEPIGVVAQIAPWNGPFAMTIMKSAGALLAGCAVVDKPAIETPFDAMYWATALQQAGLPAGQYNLAPGDAKAGMHLVEHRDVDMVSFTGGTAAGRAIGAACGQALKPALLELGGKSPAIVLDDADLDIVAKSVCGSLLPNTGQVCSGFTRVLVPPQLRAALTERLVALAEAVTIGDPLDPATTMGPVGSARQFVNVTRYIRTGIAEGARLLTGGDGRPEGLDRGYYVRPTVFDQVTNSMTVAREEIFGPVICVLEYDSVEDAIAIANDSDFGLHAGVFSSDQDRALAVAARLRTGSVTINAFTINFESPRDGVKNSGLGVRFGLEGFEENKILKTINVAPTPDAFTPASLLPGAAGAS